MITAIGGVGVQGLKFGALSLIAFAAGCDTQAKREEGAFLACEAFLKGGLKAPSTYKRISAFSSRPENGQQEVSLQFDSDNSFGVPIRGVASCAFRLDHDGRLPTPEEAMFAAHGSQLEATLRATREVRPTGDKAPPIDCCLPARGR